MATQEERDRAHRLSTENTKFYPLGNGLYRVVGINRCAITNRYISSSTPHIHTTDDDKPD